MKMPAESSSAVRSQLRDFNADSRMIILSALALVLGLAGAVLAYFLLHLIYAATNLFYFHRFGWQFVSPADNHLHWLAVFVPIVGRTPDRADGALWVGQDPRPRHAGGHRSDPDSRREG